MHMHLQNRQLHTIIIFCSICTPCSCDRRNCKPMQPVEVVVGHRPQGIHLKRTCYVDVDFRKCVVPQGSVHNVALKPKPRSAKKNKNDFVLIHNILFKLLDIETIQPFKFCRKLELRSLRQTLVAKHWSRLS